ncbi:MAG: insulinase family protein [Hydrococcus sp. Prado102]|jgi:zinc protease|nr:insulinase family protein [Hydrococcus sp. Prado102]
MRFFSKIRPTLIIGLLISLLVASLVMVTGDRINAATPTDVVPVSASALVEGVRKTVLNNGLTVLTKEVHTAPVVSVQVWYRVGSRNEKPGVNGLSHQLEHLQFKGTSDRQTSP